MNGNPLQSSCLENSMNRGAWQTIVYGVKESDMTERALIGFTTGKINALPIAYCFN